MRQAHKVTDSGFHSVQNLQPPSGLILPLTPTGSPVTGQQGTLQAEPLRVSHRARPAGMARRTVLPRATTWGTFPSYHLIGGTPPGDACRLIGEHPRRRCLTQLGNRSQPPGAHVMAYPHRVLGLHTYVALRVHLNASQHDWSIIIDASNVTK